MTLATNPLDVIKTRLQAQMKVGSAGGSAEQLSYDRFFSATGKIAREEGIYRGLVVPGMSAALLRETAYSSIRFGLYSRMKLIISGENRDPTIFQKMAAG